MMQERVVLLTVRSNGLPGLRMPAGWQTETGNDRLQSMPEQAAVPHGRDLMKGRSASAMMQFACDPDQTLDADRLNWKRSQK